MTRIASYRGNKFHAPENSYFALISAYIAGADILEFDVQSTKDGEIVVVSDRPLADWTNGVGDVSELTYAELHNLDFGAKFSVRGSNALTWKRDPPHVRVQTVGALLDELPNAVFKIANIHLNKAAPAADVTKKVIAAFERRGLSNFSIASEDVSILRSAKQISNQVSTTFVGADENEFPNWLAESPDSLIIPIDLVLDSSSKLTAFARKLQNNFEANKFPDGVIIRASSVTDVFVEEQFSSLQTESFVWAISMGSVLDVAAFSKNHRNLESQAFDGEDEPDPRFRFGYAKANRFAHVFQKDGVHIKISAYQGPPEIVPPPTNDPIIKKLLSLQESVWSANRDWPFYSGGGVGTGFGIDGDFVAVVDFSMTTSSQATMLEMACINVDPPSHRPGWRDENGTRVPNVPKSFRDKDSFFDPHGAPPFVGVEHDEDDGYRINWNLGTEYDSNQYGRPHGDGTTKMGSLRLERRGPYFASYYKDEQNPDWVCVGVCRNDSMNRRVFIRCAGKRWRQENEDPNATSPYFPIVENHIIFKNFNVSTCLED